MQLQEFRVFTERGGTVLVHRVESYTRDLAARHAMSKRPESKVLRVETGWDVVAICCGCGAFIYAEEDYCRDRGKIRCFGCS